MKFKVAIACTAALISVGCAETGSSAQGQPRAISQSAASQAAQQHPQIIQQFGGTASAPLNNYVASVGRRVAQQSGVPGGAGAFTITTLNSPVVNAFAVPGGYVYVTRQLLMLMEDEAELASVLGHEIGHIAARHGQQRQTRGVISQLGALAVGVLTGSDTLGQLAGQVGQGFLLNYSRSQEYQADDLGIRYLAGAGYAPQASAGLLDSLGDNETLTARVSGSDQRAVPSWARSHPLSADRVRRAQQRAGTVKANASLRNRDQFLAQIDGMLVDDDPRQGIVDGREFLHPGLRLRFSAPDGYGIQNGAQAVTIAGSGGQAQFAAGQFRGDLDTYVVQTFRSLVGQSQVSIPAARRTTVNGIPAAYATARASTQQGQVDVTVFAYQWDSNSAYHFVTITPAGQGLGVFNSTVQSVRRLSASEAAAIRPRVIDIVTVKAGDTPRSLAERMAYRDLKLERFLVLNSMEANDGLRPGQKVKLVVYGS
jgi:predicted Zn-dependent protease